MKPPCPLSWVSSWRNPPIWAPTKGGENTQETRRPSWTSRHVQSKEGCGGSEIPLSWISCCRCYTKIKTLECVRFFQNLRSQPQLEYSSDLTYLENIIITKIIITLKKINSDNKMNWKYKSMVKSYFWK